MNGSGAADDPLGHRAYEQFRPVCPPARRDDDVGEVIGPGVFDDGRRGIAPGHRHALAAKTFGKPHRLRRASLPCLLPPAAAFDVDGGPWATQPVGDAARLPDQGRAARTAVNVDQQSLAGLPRAADGLAAHVVDHLLVDALGRAAQSQLTKGRQVSRLEIVLDGPFGLVRDVDLAVVQPPDQVLGREVDEFDVVGPVDHRVRHRLPHPDAGDARDHVVQALDVLDVQRAEDVDPRRPAAPRRPGSVSDAGCPARSCAPARPPAPGGDGRASTASRSISSTVRPRYSTI